jgi:hypothetical protein
MRGPRVIRSLHGHEDHEAGIIGINQVVWDPAANTLHAKSDQLLEQDTPYALVVTDGLHDVAGNPVQPAATFAELLREEIDTSQAYLNELSEALHELSKAVTGKEHLSHIVVASVFTTQSVTAILEKIRDQIAATTPAPASFLLGPGGAPDGFPACRHNRHDAKRADRHSAFLYVVRPRSLPRRSK